MNNDFIFVEPAPSKEWVWTENNIRRMQDVKEVADIYGF